MRRRRWKSRRYSLRSILCCQVSEIKKDAPNKPGFLNVIDLNLDFSRNAIELLGSKMLFYPPNSNNFHHTRVKLSYT